jgi:hypothetical protein|tara:strand:+ start:30 stop:203 length:174 start_codon:yes stop_codon:yes gene_type:complete
MTAKIIAEILQKLTTTKFVSEIIITVLEQLAKLSDSKVDDKLVQVCREALLTEEKSS